MADEPVLITYDSYNLQDSTIITSDIEGDDSAPRKEIGIYEMPVIHGAKQTFEKYAARRITVQGIVKSTTASGLVGKMEELKEVLSRRDKTLQLTYPGTYNRIYTASVEGAPEIARPSWAVNIANFKATFIATQPFSNQTLTTVSGVYNVNSAITNLSVGISGMADPQPQIYFNTTASGSKFVLNNQTTNEAMTVNTTFSGTGRQLLIDCNNFQVQLDGVPQNFSGKFPSFVPGVNTLSILTFGTAGASLDQYAQNEALGSTYFSNIGKTNYGAQSFVPTRASLIYCELYLGYNALYNPTPTDITVEIRTNSGGVPTSTVVATGVIKAFSSSLSSPSWRQALFSSAVTLTPGTTYWIVAYVPGSGNNYAYAWYHAYQSDIYASGGRAHSGTSGATWTAATAPFIGDFLFRTYSDGGGTPLSGKLVIQYNPRRW